MTKLTRLEQLKDDQITYLLIKNAETVVMWRIVLMDIL